MLNNWKTYKLGDLVTFQRGHDLTKTQNIEGSYPVAGSNGIIGYHNKFTTKAPSITIGRSGNIGNPYYYDIDFWAHNTTLYIKEFKNCNPKFIYYLLKTINFGGHNSGSAVPSLNRNYIHPIEVNAPDLATQTQIAQILSSLDDKIELNLQMNQTLEAMAQALFKEWFVDFNFPDFDGELENGLPKGWRMGKLEELIEFTNGYAFKSSELLGEYEDDCYFVFKMGNIKKGGGLKYDGTKSYYKKENAHNLKKYILKKGDLLMCMTDMKDNVALLGHTALMNEDDKFVVNQRVGLLRPKNDDSIDYPYLYILTNYPEFIVELRSRANRGVQVNLSTSEIKNIQVIIPPKSINKLFDDVVKPIFEKIFFNTEQIQTLTQTRDALLPKLMSGKVLR